MMSELASSQQMVPVTQPAGRWHHRTAIIIVALSLLFFLAVAPWARTRLPAAPAFIGAYASALVTLDLVTAALLYAQFAASRMPALLLVACAYMFTALMTVVHALTFPGLFSATGLLGADAQTTAWLYLLWHACFPVAIIGYAAIRAAKPARPHSIAALVSLSILCTAVAVAAMAVLACRYAPLPEIMQGSRYTPAMFPVVLGVWSISLIALVAVWLHRPLSILDLWLMVALSAWLFDIALSAVLNGGRFDVGFYFGRIYGLWSASVLLIVLVVQTFALYARRARLLLAEGEERARQLDVLRAELIQVSRLSELGQMVRGLAHEVIQPLAATRNFLHAAQQSVEDGDIAGVPATLQKADAALARTGSIIQGLREFVKRDDGRRRTEDLRSAIEEVMMLAVAASERRSLHTELVIHPQAASAVVDRIQIQQVLLNLIRNAIEAVADSPRPRLVVATAPSNPGRIEVSIRDNGKGLDPAVRERLFEPLVSAKSDSLGIGLSICRSIIEAHGGRIWCEDAPGAGTVFKFTLPTSID